ncbi:MAG: hypothetical protein WCY27_03990 [archaeon]|jgi:hypothetical protein|nr:DUF2683 family protein [archaeon]MDD3074502.1 DUF2683 family protein [Eubacteriales bacterium]
MLDKTVNVNLKISNYSNRVLGVVKEKYGYKDKSQALNRILDIYGDEFVDKETKEEIILEVIDEVNKLKKQKIKPMSKKDLNNFFESVRE